MAFRNRIVVLGLMLAMLAIAQGCSSKPEMAERNVIVSLDESLARATAVQVDILGANETELARLTSWPVDEYWRDASMNKVPSDRKTLKLSSSMRSATLSRSDPVWQQWRNKGAMHLVAIGFIPGLSGSGEGDRDRRRIILPLDKNRWKEPLVDIQIIVSQSGMTSPTQPEPPKK